MDLAVAFTGFDSEEKFRQQILLGEKLLEKYKIGRLYTHVSVLTYANTSTVEFDFNTGSDHDLVKYNLQSLNNPGTSNYAGHILETLTHSVFIKRYGSRPFVHKTILLFVNEPIYDITAVTSAKKLVSLGIQLVIVVYGVAFDKAYLNQLVRKPEDLFLIDMENVNKEDILEKTLPGGKKLFKLCFVKSKLWLHTI